MRLAPLLIDGRSVLFGERSPLIDGRSVLFDDAYFIRSILDDSWFSRSTRPPRSRRRFRSSL